MSLVGFLILLLVASITGSLGAAIAGSDHKGCLTSIVLGFAGALIGTWLSRETGIHDFLYFRGIPIIWSVIGAAILVGVVNAFSGGSKSKK